MLLGQTCQAWNGKSSRWVAYNLAGTQSVKPRSYLMVKPCTISRPLNKKHTDDCYRTSVLLHNCTMSSICSTQLYSNAAAGWRVPLHTVTQTPLLFVKLRFYRQCQLQSVGSSVNVSMNSVKDHMLRVWPWERLVYLTHSPWSPISVPLITNRLFHILLQYSTLTYLNSNQNKILTTNIKKNLQESDTKITALINSRPAWRRYFIKMKYYIPKVIKHYKHYSYSRGMRNKPS